MKYTFAIEINGSGESATEAWNDAVTALSMDPGPTPERGEYEMEDDDGNLIDNRVNPEQTSGAVGGVSTPAPELTDKQYVEAEGNLCPECGLKTVDTSGPISSTGDTATQSCHCTNDACSAEWADVWRLVGFDNLNE